MKNDNERASAGYRVAITVITLAWCVVAPAETNYIEPYFEDDVVTVEPAEPNGLQPFIIPTYNGLLRMGIPYKYEIPHDVRDMDVLRTKTSRIEGAMRKDKGLITYLGLLAFSQNKEEVSLAGLRDALLGGDSIHQIRYAPGYARWANNMLYLARATLNDTEYRKYLCSEGVPCPLDKFKTSRPYRAIGYHIVPFWGGAKNDFRMRGAYRAFTEDYGQRLFDWGDKLSRRIAVVSYAHLSNYDFDTQSFIVAVPPAIPISADSQVQLTDRSTAGYDIAFPGARQAQFAKIQVTLKMSLDDAEALREAVTASGRKHSVPMLAVYEGELTSIALTAGMTIPRDRLQVDFEHKIVGDRIEFFFGPALKDKAFEVRL